MPAKCGIGAGRLAMCRAAAARSPRRSAIMPRTLRATQACPSAASVCGGGQGGLGFDGGVGEPARGQVHARAQDRRDRLGRDALQLVVAGRPEDAVRLVDPAQVHQGGGQRQQRLGVAGIRRHPGAAACRVTQGLQCLADPALVPADHGAGDVSRRDDLVAVVAGGGEDSACQTAGRRLGGHPSQRPELRD